MYISLKIAAAAMSGKRRDSTGRLLFVSVVTAFTGSVLTS